MALYQDALGSISFSVIVGAVDRVSGFQDLIRKNKIIHFPIRQLDFG
jgi:hypothetical protein